MEERNEIIYARVQKPIPNDPLNRYWRIVVTVCDKEKYLFVCPKEPTEKVFRKCINNALNRYIHGGSKHDES